MKAKRGRVRLIVLAVLLVVCGAVYLPVRQARLNEALTQAVLNNDEEAVHRLLDNGADPDERIGGRAQADMSAGLWQWVRSLFTRHSDRPASVGKTPLMFAASTGRILIASDLLAHGANTRVRLNNGATALLIASGRDNTELVQAILKHGGDVRDRDGEGLTPLHRACMTGAAKTAHLLLDNGADINATDKQGRMPLELAAEIGREATMPLLIERGADVRPLYAGGMSPFLWAGKLGSVELFTLLEQKHLDMHTRDATAVTALNLAVASGSVPAVQWLLKRGVSINASGLVPTPRTPPIMGRGFALNGAGAGIQLTDNVMVTAGSKPLAMLKLLCAHGGDVNARDLGGETALIRAVSAGHLEEARFLLQHGADVNARDKSGQSSLLRAAYSLNKQMALMLVNASANVNVRDPQGRTPLMQAQTLPVAQAMIAHGADVNARDAAGLTPLIYAVNNGQTEIVSLFIQHGADVNAVGRKGETALAAAQHWPVPSIHDKMVDMLEKAGAKP